jgi:hypothetical protein
MECGFCIVKAEFGGLYGLAGRGLWTVTRPGYCASLVVEPEAVRASTRGRQTKIPEPFVNGGGPHIIGAVGQTRSHSGDTSENITFSHIAFKCALPAASGSMLDNGW